MPNHPATDSWLLPSDYGVGDFYAPKPDGCYCDLGDFTDDDPCGICREAAHERFLEDTRGDFR